MQIKMKTSMSRYCPVPQWQHLQQIFLEEGEIRIRSCIVNLVKLVMSLICKCNYFVKKQCCTKINIINFLQRSKQYVSYSNFQIQKLEILYARSLVICTIWILVMWILNQAYDITVIEYIFLYIQSIRSHYQTALLQFFFIRKDVTKLGLIRLQM